MGGAGTLTGADGLGVFPGRKLREDTLIVFKHWKGCYWKEEFDKMIFSMPSERSEETS